MLKKQGFTLIEILVTIFIISTVLISVMELSQIVIRNNNATKKILEASLIAESYMQEIRSKTFGSGCSDPGTSVRTNYSACQYNYLSANSNITNLKGEPIADLLLNTDYVGTQMTDIALYKITVTVATDSLWNTDVPTASLYKITITVTDAANGNTYVVLTGYKANV